VAVLEFGHFWNKLYLSAPICFSSNNPQVPKFFSFISLHVCKRLAPVAFDTLSISSAGTLPAQNKLRSAKYWVAKSPIGNLLKTTFAPEFTIFSNFLLIIFHSASTKD